MSAFTATSYFFLLCITHAHGHPLCEFTANNDSSTPVIHTKDEWVRGCTLAGGGSAFTVPFAEPPIGDLRFRAPRHLSAPWDGVFDGTRFATPCPQFSETASDEARFYGQEDCLYLSVHVPPSAVQRNATTEGGGQPLLPVMFWIYGGAFVLGDSYEFGWYDPKTFVQKNDVIIVAANYRVSALGFLAHQALKEEDAADRNVPLSDGSTGNMGLRDQRLAMTWVQDNIGGFGGDPDRVTIFGESAGGISVCAHVANGEACEGLFSGAVMESGTCDGPELFLNDTNAMLFGEDYARLVWGCGGDDDDDSVNAKAKANGDYKSEEVDYEASSNSSSSSSSIFLACARNKTTAELMYGFLKAFKPVDDAHRANFRYLPPLFPLVPFATVVDGSSAGIPVLPLQALLAKRLRAVDGRGSGENVVTNKGAMKVPFLMGTNKDKGTIFVPLVKSIVNNVSSLRRSKMTLNDLSAILEQILCTPTFPGQDCDPPAVLAQYDNCEGYESVTACTAVVLRDYIFLCPTRRAAAAHANAELSNDVWVYQFRYASDWLDMESALGNYHTSELYFVWDNPWPFIRNKTTTTTRPTVVPSSGTAIIPSSITDVHTFSPEDEAMASTFGAYWTAFASGGDPNYSEKTGSFPSSSSSSSSSLPLWAKVGPSEALDDMPHMQLEQPPSVSHGLNAATCDFWDGFLGFGS